jgi:inosine-uridine nucleoside N-ribohydrolase
VEGDLKKKIIIDTDVGMGIPGSDIDDGLALILALRSPEVEVEAVTTVTGNVSADEASTCALSIMELLGINHIPVAVGASRPLLGNTNIDPIREVYSRTLSKSGLQTLRPKPSKLEPVSLHAVDLIISKVMQYPGEITLVAIGPLTNVALSIAKEPKIAENIRELIIMGGAATILPYCVTPVAEFNVYIDPEATKIVLSSKIPKKVLVGFDVTMKVFLRREHLATLRRVNHPLIDFVVDQVEQWITFLQHLFPRRVEFSEGCPLHDPLAVAIAFERSLVKVEKMYVDVETKGELTRGQIVADRGWEILSTISPHNEVEVCIDVDSQRFLDLLLHRLVM